MNTESQGLLCPACAVALVMSERQSIEIDYCPKCRGVWLDRGELDKLIEKSVAQAAPSRDDEPRSRDDEPRSRDDDRHRGGHHGSRRKSWLSDIFG